MECPKCHAPMEKVTYQNIEVDRCTGCHGLWFNRYEKEQLKNLDGAEAIDIGRPQAGATPDQTVVIRCSTCQVPMLRMVDAKQPHIWYESCPSCYGVFLDAGEFRDYKQEDLLDFLRDLFSHERP